ncbi:MAG: hypothetical protein ACREOG_12565 [Gemmatimonadaceae bacterium]
MRENIGPFAAHATVARSDPNANSSGVRRIDPTIKFFRADLEANRVADWFDRFYWTRSQSEE